MADSITLRIITPDSIVLDTTVASVKIPASDGSLGILPRHAPMVAALGMGELAYVHGGREEVMFVAGGFAEVRKNTVRVVTEASERPTDIDVERATEAAERARERLRQGYLPGGEKIVDLLRAEMALRRAMMRQNLARKWN